MLKADRAAFDSRVVLKNPNGKIIKQRPRRAERKYGRLRAQFVELRDHFRLEPAVAWASAQPQASNRLLDEKSGDASQRGFAFF
jgi:hypothetical protein